MKDLGNQNYIHNISLICITYLMLDVLESYLYICLMNSNMDIPERVNILIGACTSLLLASIIIKLIFPV